MRTARCFDRDRRQAKWAISRRDDRCLLFVLQTIHPANQREYDERDNQEVEQSIEEDSVIDGRRTRSFCLGERGIRMSREVNKFIREIRVTGEQSNGGHQDIGNEGTNYSSEGGSNDNSDRHVEHAAVHRELFEFSEHPAPFALQQRFGAA